MSKEPCVVWFTGLSGAGKTTLAEKLAAYLKNSGEKCELLDGDTVRNIFPQTGFTKKERDEHVKRMGFLASMLERNGVTVLASFISPYRESRDFVRKMCRNFVEVYVSTSLEVCEKRDVKVQKGETRRNKIFHRDRRSVRSAAPPRDHDKY